MTDEMKDKAGPGLGCPPDTKGASANADGSIPSPASYIQPDGPTKKKRGRPKKRDKDKHPIACEAKLNEFKFQKRVYYPSSEGGGKYGIVLYCDSLPTCDIFIAMFTEQPDGSIRWSPQKMNNPYRPYLYSFVPIHKFLLDGVIQALKEAKDEWVGGDRKIQERLEEVQQVSADNELTKKLRGWKGVL